MYTSLFAVWPLKNSDLLLMNSSDFSTLWLSGKMTWFFHPSASESGSAYSPMATSAASFLFVAWLVTANAEPPQLTETGFALSHCGSGATAQTPFDAPTPTPAPVRYPGAHAAEV